MDAINFTLCNSCAAAHCLAPLERASPLGAARRASLPLKVKTRSPATANQPPAQTRLTILDHFMLEGVKALFRFTMAILYLAFQTTPPSSCEVFTTIRNTARDMYDLKLLLSIVDQIKLPKDSYFAIRRSFYMVQSSFNSDQFYMQSLSNDAHRQLVSSKPLSVQQPPSTRPPAMSLISAAPLVSQDNQLAGLAQANKGQPGPRVCTSANKSKICIQNIGKLGRSHIKLTDAHNKSNERSLISPMRNCLVIGVSDCGKTIVVARQSSKRCFRVFREQDLTFHVYEMNVEILDGFYLEASRLALVISAAGELFKLAAPDVKSDTAQIKSIETLMLRDCGSIDDDEKLKIRISSMDSLTNLLWVYVECEDARQPNPGRPDKRADRAREDDSHRAPPKGAQCRPANGARLDDSFRAFEQCRVNHRRKIIIVDVLTFDIFSAFELHQSFGDIISMKTTLLAFCLLANPMSNQFASRMVRIGPTGRFEHLLSFSDVVDYSIIIPDHWRKNNAPKSKSKAVVQTNNQKSFTIKKLLPRSMSLNLMEDSKLSRNGCVEVEEKREEKKLERANSGRLIKYYRSLMRHQSVVNEDLSATSGSRDSSPVPGSEPLPSIKVQLATTSTESSSPVLEPMGSISKIFSKAFGSDSSCLGEADDKGEFDYIPINMTFIFRNGKIAMFEFTESYAVHTRESQLDRYDYSRVIDVMKDGQDFILTILTIFERLIKVVI